MLTLICHVSYLYPVTSCFLPQEESMPVYNVTADIFSKRFIVGMKAGQMVNLRLCYENIAVCEGIESHKVSVLDSQICKSGNV